MSKKRRNRNSRDAPAQQRQQGVMLCSPDAWQVLCGDGYKPLSSCPEVQICIGVYADAIASMTIMQMENTDKGDKRIKDGLSRKLDIEPCRYMIHHTWMSNIVRVMLSTGNQVTVPHYEGDLLGDLEPIPPSKVTFLPDGRYYKVMIQGVPFSPGEVLHFPINPDPEQPWRGTGFKVALEDVVKSLRQSNATKQAVQKAPMPSLIIKVDSYEEKLQTAEGRHEVAQQYVMSTNSGEPWVLNADVFEVEQIRPMTLNDMAIDKTIELDKRAAAAIMGVPAFLVGVGSFRADEYAWWVANKVMPIAHIIQQELTAKLLVSPNRYFKLNNWSLINYDLTKINAVCKDMTGNAAMTRNEWRDKVGMSPREDMEEILVLENFIRVNKNQQTKQTGGESDGT